MKTDDIKVVPRWSKSKEEIWDAKFADLEESPRKHRTVMRNRRMVWYAAAAVVAILIILPSVAFFPTKEITAPRGEHMLVTLPDGSTARLNAESSVAYRPLWWKISRKVEMTGEVFFEVGQGRRFSVESPHGTVRVLGTSFNVYDREAYTVACLTGKVEVLSGGGSVILIPGMSARYQENTLTAGEDAAVTPGWLTGQFRFESAPLSEVIAEVERQYDIKVPLPDNADYLYTGHFAIAQSPEQVLEIIGKPFGITFKIE